jgi:hypothetical protein
VRADFWILNISNPADVPQSCCFSDVSIANDEENLLTVLEDQ